MNPSPIPVTILTGFLGSGKTTLLKRILEEQHGERIAVIENEFGAEGIDNELLWREGEEQIVQMNNGCLCCTVRQDLIRILGELSAQRRSGKLHFDRVLIETTGLADPSPVAQTFFVDDTVNEHYNLDAILTLVDAKHAQQQLDSHSEAQEQVGFADRLLLSKTDLVSADEVTALRARLAGMNPRAHIRNVDFGVAPINELIGIRGFNLDAVLDLEPHFLDDHHHHTHSDVASFVYRQPHPMNLDRIEEFLGAIVLVYGARMMRYKGILNILGKDHRYVFQGVHMLMGADIGARWKKGEPRETKIVFIGKDLPRETLVRGLNNCIAIAD